VLAHVGLDGGAGLAAEYAGGREVDLLLGTAQPWLIASAQLAPLALGAWLIAYPGVWLLYVTIVAVMIGAVSVPAAARSRALWLRGGWSRAALFRRVEQAFWRHNAYALGVSLLALTAVGSYLGLSSGTLALGIPLLVLATIISTYLGLVATRGIGPLDMVLAIGAMSMLMAAAVRAAEPAGRLPELALLGSALAATAFGLRWLAARRWRAIDWTACRPEPAATRARA
jgi:hypothetical protein